MKSIRRFLIIVLLVSIMLTSFVAATYGYRSSMAKAEQLFDKQLANIAGVLAETPPGYYRTATGDSAIAFQIWQGDSLEASSGNLPANPIAAFETGYSDVKIGGFRWRAFAHYLPASQRWVIVAESADIRSALADSIILDSVKPIIFGLPVYGLLIWIIVGYGLRPLSDLAKKMRIKRSEDLSPVSDLEPPLELLELVSSFNDLLLRLNTSFERERQFAADAAHELRTPISVLKLQIHNLNEDTQGEIPQLLPIQYAVEQMERSVEQVLMLYRVSPDQFVSHFETIDLTSLVRETITGLYPQLKVRQQQIELLGPPAKISGDAFALSTLLSNLIGNASRYSGEGSIIKVTVEQQADETVLTVEDSGPGIPTHQRERVFERFYQGQHDAAADGSGIGLAIVQNIADIHGARISLAESGFDTGLAVSVVFRNQHVQ
jgi:two-component system sensor histidine kinase QseC